MPDLSPCRGTFDDQIVQQIAQLRATVQEAVSIEHGDHPRAGILRLLDSLLQQPAHAAEVLRSLSGPKH